MPNIPSKLDDAFVKIRLGRVEEGMRLFDKVNGFETFKYAALAELACFRHDWKHFLSFTQDFLLSEETDNTVFRPFSQPPFFNYGEGLCTLSVLAACHTECWKETKLLLEQLQTKYPPGKYGKKGDNFLYQAKALLSDPKNTVRKFLEATPHLKAERSEKGAKLIGYDIGSILAVFSCHFHSRFSKRRGLGKAGTYRGYFNNIISEGSTEDVIAVYKKYHNQLTDFDDHLSAAKCYIALDDLDGAKRAVANGVPYWEYYEPFQVAPLELFLDNELWPVMQDTRFSQSLLSIKRNNPAG